MSTPRRPIVPGHEKLTEQHFREAAESHWAWQLSAGEIRNAVEILHKEIKKNWRGFLKGKPAFLSPGSVCMMLCGQMLEALFKAILVSQEGAFNSKGKFAHKGHNLLWLADQVGLKVSENEAWLLERLTHFVKWAGRYPIALVMRACLERILVAGLVDLPISGWGRTEKTMTLRLQRTWRSA
jgi:hypothetical protein